jgi:hypothetical protein
MLMPVTITPARETEWRFARDLAMAIVEITNGVNLPLARKPSDEEVERALGQVGSSQADIQSRCFALGIARDDYLARVRRICKWLVGRAQSSRAAVIDAQADQVDADASEFARGLMEKRAEIARLQRECSQLEDAVDGAAGQVKHLRQQAGTIRQRGLHEMQKSARRYSAKVAVLRQQLAAVRENVVVPPGVLDVVDTAGQPRRLTYKEAIRESRSRNKVQAGIARRALTRFEDYRVKFEKAREESLALEAEIDEWMNAWRLVESVDVFGTDDSAAVDAADIVRQRHMGDMLEMRADPARMPQGAMATSRVPAR